MLLDGAPEGTIGLVPSLLIVIGADVVRLPVPSYATAFTMYAAFGSGPVSHPPLPEHAVLLHGSVANTLPAPHSSILVSPTLSDAWAVTVMLLPVHTPLRGAVMETVGGTVSVPPVLPVPPLVVFETLTLRLALPVPPAESVTVAASVTPPFAVAVVFQLKLALVPE